MKFLSRPSPCPDCNLLKDKRSPRCKSCSAKRFYSLPENKKRLLKNFEGKLDYWKGKKKTEEQKTAIREKLKKTARRGDKHPYWKGGVTNVNNNFRKSTLYKKWRQLVFERDNYICQICFKKGGNLNADHIKPFALFPELRLELSNGRTLCVQCHKLTDTYGKNIPKKQIEMGYTSGYYQDVNRLKKL